MRSLLLLSLALAVSSGCASQQLRFTTLRQTSSLADLQESQVLENFARLAANPGSVPFYATANTGAVTVADVGSGSLSFVGGSKLFTSGTYGLGANRTVTVNWGLAPLNNPDRLKAMRAAYLLALRRSPVDPAELAKLEAALGQDPSYRIQSGWICVGRRRDVPREALKVARDGPIYVWIMPEQAGEFGRFVLLTLNLASLPSGPPTSRSMTSAPVTGGIAPVSPAVSPFPSRLYDQPPGINPGLFFLPRQ